MPPMPFPIPLLFITAVKDICAINTFEKLLNILFSEVYCWHFGFRRLLFSVTITDMWLYELLNLFTRWPLVFRSFLHPPLVPRQGSYYITGNEEWRGMKGWRKDRNTSGQRGNKFSTSYRDISVIVAENNSVVKPKYQHYTSLNKMLSKFFTSFDGTYIFYCCNKQ